MRHLAIVALLGAAALVAGGSPGCAVEDPEPEPTRYVVARGDTLFLIAKAHGVTVDELRRWNGLEGDLIEVDQVLEIWPGQRPVEVAKGSPASSRGAAKRGSATGEGTAERPDLELPPEKACLAGPTLEGGADEAMAASEGLSEAEIREAIGGFVHHTLPCITDSPTTPLDLEITVACTGRVAAVRIADQGDWSSEVARCVTETLRYAPFPAHDLPDGETFRYPLRFTPG